MDNPNNPTPEEIQRAKEVLERAQQAQNQPSGPEETAIGATPTAGPTGAPGARLSPDEALMAEYQLGPISEQPDDPAKVEQAEESLRNANLANIRKDKAGAKAHYKAALELAPNTPSVLEAVADDLRERKFFKPAQMLYKRAVEIEPTNARIESKLGECALEVLQMSDPMAMLAGSNADPSMVVNANASVILSVLLPGLGQMVTGRVGLGIGFMIVWVSSWVWAIATPNGISGLLGGMGLTLAQTGAPFNSVVLLPLAIAAFTHLVAIFEAAGRAKRYAPKRVEKPVPPSDLPYEL